VITAVDGESVEGAGDLTRAINKKKDGDITLTVVRNKGQRSITVTPREGGFPSTQTGSRQVRRIVIPQIELPTVPEMNIKLPRIELPVIPEINITIPRAPRVRVGTVRQPI
jgi:C-terminal processing protease CtpA/Prc